MIHSYWSFFDEVTICGQPVEYELRNGNPRDKILTNIALELEDITCPICKSKKEKAYAPA